MKGSMMQHPDASVLVSWCPSRYSCSVMAFRDGPHAHQALTAFNWLSTFLVVLGSDVMTVKEPIRSPYRPMFLA